MCRPHIEKYRGQKTDRLLRKLAKLCRNNERKEKAFRQMVSITDGDYAKVLFYLRWSGVMKS